jgi:ABC-type lipoprotein release transport system permease subunit
VERQRDLKSTRELPWLLGSFIVALAIGAVAHTLASTSRQRRSDVAILQTMGLRRRDARLTVFWHAMFAGAVAIAVGVPLGWALGRTLWEAVTEQLPVEYARPRGAVAVVAVALAALGILNALAAYTARRTARDEPALVLRAE